MSGKNTKVKSEPLALVPGEIIEGISDGLSVHFEIEKYLGEGWTAVVYSGVKVEQPDQPVALKVLRPNSDELTVMNFHDEVRILSSIRQEGITCVPEVYGLFNGVFKGNDIEFIAMELVSDQKYQRLDHLLEARGALNEDIALEIAHQALTLLDRLHTRVGRTYTDMQLKDFYWNEKAKNRRLMVIDWNHVSFERHVIETGLKDQAPSVLQQLRARGAKDFDDLVRLDVLRFASYFYTFLTGKHALESGETVWSLKTHGGERWQNLSEYVRQIVQKALVTHPWLKSYSTAVEMDGDLINAAMKLHKEKDFDLLRDKLGDDLDEIDDGDNAVNAFDDIQQAKLRIQRLEKINEANALLFQIKRLSESKTSDSLVQKWLARQEERIQNLTLGISPSWGTGQRYFELGQYQTTLDLWEDEAKRQGEVNLWRRVMLVQIAIENSEFIRLKPYLVEALESLDAGDINGALEKFNKGLSEAGVREITGPLAMLKAEMMCLQQIKWAAMPGSSKTVEYLNNAVEGLKAARIPYQDILLRDPFWSSLVMNWLSEEQQREFDTSGKTDVVKAIEGYIQSMKEEQRVALGKESALKEAEQLIVDTLSGKSSIASMQARLSARPDDQVLFEVLWDHAKELRSDLTRAKEDKSTELQSRLTTMRQLISLVLNRGAPSGNTEKKLRGELSQLCADEYSEVLRTEIDQEGWKLADQAAKMLVFQIGKGAREMNVVSHIVEIFVKEADAGLNEIKNENLPAVHTHQYRLQRLHEVLEILQVSGTAERELKLKRVENGIGTLHDRQKEKANVLAELKVKQELADLEMAFLIDIAAEVMPRDGVMPDYKNIQDKIEKHSQKIVQEYEAHSSDNPNFKDWMDRIQKYKESLEAIMGQQKDFDEFSEVIAQCIKAIAVFNQQEANDKLNMARSRMLSTGKDKQLRTERFAAINEAVQGLPDWIRSRSEIQESLKSFDESFSQHFTQRVVQIAELRPAREKCDLLLQKQKELAQKFSAFSFAGLEELDRRIRLWEQLIPFAKAISDSNTKVFVSTKENNIEKPATQPAAGITSTPNNQKREWKPFLGWVIAGILMLAIVGIIIVPPILSGQASRNTVAASIQQATLIANNVSDISRATTFAINETATADAAAVTGTTMATKAPDAPTPSDSAKSTEILSDNPAATLIPKVKFFGIINQGPNGEQFVNFRLQPDWDKGKVLIASGIPKTTTIEIIGKISSSKYGDWFLILYNNQCGWVNAPRVDLQNTNVTLIPTADANFCLSKPAVTISPTATH